MLDWDGDGDLDMYAVVGGFYHGDLWETPFDLNEGPNKNHWLEVELSQEGHNRLAVGAAVTVRAGKLNQYQEVRNGRGFGSSDPPTLHYGLGQSLQGREADGALARSSRWWSIPRPPWTGRSGFTRETRPGR